MGPAKRKVKRGFSLIQGRALLLGMILFVLIVAALSFRQYQIERNGVLRSLQGKCSERLALLDAAASSISSYVSRMTHRAHRFLAEMEDVPVPSPYFHMIEYNEEEGYYYIDRISAPYREETAGNIFGLGNPFDRGSNFIKRFNLAAELFTMQEAMHADDPHIVHSQYISPNGDISSVFPYESIETKLSLVGDITEHLRYVPTWLANPVRCPERKPYWTDSYVDSWGLVGMVVTRVSHLYDGDEFLGAIGADITVSFFNELMTPFQDPAGMLLLSTAPAGGHGSEVLATSQGIDTTYQNIVWPEQVLPEGLREVSWELITAEKTDIPRLGGYYVISRSMNSAPWTLTYLISEQELAMFLRPQITAYVVLMASLIAFFVFIYLLVSRRYIKPAMLAEEARAKLAAIVEDSDDAIIGNDLDGAIVSWNSGAASVFGYSREEAIGQPISVLLSREKIDEIPRMLEHIGHGEQVKHFETVGKTKDGTLLHVSLSISPIRDSAAGVVGASMIARDITERKESEIALARARQEAEQASQAKSQFLANMSHELRTPLTAILGFSEALLDPAFGKLDEEQSLFVQRIGHSGTHLLSLINDLLDLGKIEAGKLELTLEPVDLWSICCAAADQMKAKIAHRGLALELALPEGPVVMKGDQLRLGQILLNLLSNAVKFTREGCITVWLEDHLDMVEFGVKDTGRGISPENQKRLFKHYEQVHDQRTVSEMGTGLGLALCREIAEAHGGTIRVESEVGAGSNFIVRLPKK